MVKELEALMRESVAAPPSDHVEPDVLVSAGRRRVRTRRAGLAGAAVAVLVAGGLVVSAAVMGQRGDRHDGTADEPAQSGTLHLADAEEALQGRDYRALSSHTNKNLDRDNGQYFDGVTDDGLVLFRDGPRADQLWPRMALLDPSTGDKDWLPDLRIGQTQTWPVELGSDRLVLIGVDGGLEGDLAAYLFDRSSRQWNTVKWPSLPSVDGPGAVLGPDDRVYVSVPATQGEPPEGGWPTGADGEADDSDAAGDTYRLWSVSLTDRDDVRDEGRTVGSVAFTETSMVWTDSTNGDAGMVHKRNLSTGEERSFDPHAGSRCNLLSFGATADRVVLGQYCGTDGDVRDDRVQILTSDGDQVATIRDSGMDGAMAGVDGANHLVTVTASEKRAGTYVYDLDTGRFLRISTAVSRWETGGPAPAGEFLWSTPVNGGHGDTQRLGRLLDASTPPSSSG